MSSYTVIFTIARMNPPTPGHIFLIENMIEKALDNYVKKVYIILSCKHDAQKNPLKPDQKQKILQRYGIPRAKRELIKRNPDKATEIQSTKVEIILCDKFANNVFIAVHHLLRDTYGRALCVIGTPTQLTHPRVDMCLIDRSVLPISGTLVRTIAQISFSAFASFYPGMSHKDVIFLYDKLNRMEIPLSKDVAESRLYLHRNMRYSLRSYYTVPLR